ncbi:MAG: hypothetical protein AB7S26_42820 [Sandaracinaceae bacterium]
MSHPEQADISALIEALTHAGVEFVVVGGAAAVLHGAPAQTFDLDIVHRRSPANVDRLFAALTSLDAWVRDPARRWLRPERAALEGPGQLLLSTSPGPLDILGALHDGGGYEELASTAISLVDGATRISVIDLPTLIEVKTRAGRAKDRLVLPLLLALVDESTKQGPEGG